MAVEIEFADDRDLNYLVTQDEHVTPEVLKEKLVRREVIVARSEGRTVGWLRFGYFWDVVPFMNMLFVEEDCRNKGYGTGMIGFCEKQIRARGHDLAMTSSHADERAQHLYRRLGYRDCGALLFPGQTPLEVFFAKPLA